MSALEQAKVLVDETTVAEWIVTFSKFPKAILRHCSSIILLYQRYVVVLQSIKNKIKKMLENIYE